MNAHGHGSEWLTVETNAVGLYQFMKNSTNQIQRKGIAVDALVFLSNIAFLIFLDPLLKTSSVLSAFFGGLMVATFFLYPIGAYLKKPHVQNRLRAQGAG